VAALHGGDDHASIAGNIDIPVFLDGGDGDDHLSGGKGPTAVLGGAGDDILIGSSGRDLIFGGTGEDKLRGKGGDDVLIGGRTAYDYSLASAETLRALDALLAEWNSDRDYEARVNHLRNGTGPILGDRSARLKVGETVFDDEAADDLNGSSGLNWFLANLDQDSWKSKADEEINGL
jgi:Ca2+-binding RTX toxin-like protein